MANTVKELLNNGNNIIRSISDTPYLDVSLLFEKATSLNKIQQITNPDLEIEKNKIDKFNELLSRRLNHEPIAYILGEKEFYSHPFKVTKDTLIPRADTETLVEQAIKYINNNLSNADLLDLCTGSGCVGLSIALETNLNSLTLSDISDNALDVAKENSKNLYKKNINIIKSNLLENCKTYDIIVTNPPYLTKKWCEEVSLDVKKEPLLALEGFGDDGLDIIRLIISTSKYHFKNNKGAIFIECDSRQCNTVKEILLNNNFKEIEIFKDLSNKDRVVKGIYEL